AEIVAYDFWTKRLFVVNADAAAVDVLDVSDPTLPVKIGAIDAGGLGGGVNSVAVRNGLVVIAVEADDKQADGLVAFYSAWTLNLIVTVPAGALPDMVTFSPNGRYVLVANEGEPDDDYAVDPVGSITVIDIWRGRVRTAGFEAFNGSADALRAGGVRIFGPGASVAQDLEPEFITVDKRSRFAYVTLQENNAVAKVNIRRAKVVDVFGLGSKDHSLPGNGLDPSDRDAGIAIDNWPVRGLYMPDAIASYRYRGKTYLITANEGDAREYEGDNFEFVEEERIADITLDPAAFPNAAELQDDAALGRLNITLADGDPDGDGDYDTLYSFGTRSFSIWNEYGELVFDSGADLEHITAELLPDEFNSNNDENDSFESRSDNKGPEPEGVAVGRIKGRTYAFIGLERIGGIAVYDVTVPHRARFLSYVNNRDFGGDAEAGTAGDLGPEGIAFIPAWQSPTYEPLLAVGNEVSGTTTLYRVDVSR
ncbi:MAG: choice-of-anchor I family protein, partial [Pseudomonadota bacterium]